MTSYDFHTVEGCFEYLCQESGISSEHLALVEKIVLAAKEGQAWRHAAICALDDPDATELNWIDKIRESRKKNFINLGQRAAEILSRKNDYNITITDLEFWAWPQTFGGTNPHGAGGNMITTCTVIGWRSLFHGDGVLYCAGKYRYVNRFKPMMRWK